VKRCGVCGGALLAEHVERIFQRAGVTTELRCLSCGRGPGDGPNQAAREVCLEPGCLKDRAPGSTLCASHRGSSTRTGRREG
jgi:hypothetical protein